MKILKTKLHHGILSGGKVIIPMVLVLVFWCFSQVAITQTKGELNPATLELLKTAFEEEIDHLRTEINDPTPAVNLYSNRIIIMYYESVYQAFDAGGIELREAFVSQVPVLQYGPASTHQQFIQALFTDRIGDSVVSFEVSSGMKTDAPLTPQFKNVLVQIEVKNNDLGKVKNLFGFIRNNK